MNPYATPSAAPEEDRTDSAFRIIGPMTRGRKMLNVAMIVIFAGVFLFWQFGANSGLVAGTHPNPFPVVMIFSPLISLLILHRWEKGLRANPLVLSGEARVGGLGRQKKWSKKDRGYLFLTRSELVFTPRGAGWNAGVEQRIPLSEIDLVQRPKVFGLGLESIEVYFDGTMRRFGVNYPKRWMKEIENARLGVRKVER